MNFFNKYKDLFGIPDGTPVPTTRLTINNNLFIDKPFVPTYKESLSINSKLKDMRRDYNELEQEIQSISNAMKGPRRPNSRKSKELGEVKEKDKILNNFPNQNNLSLPTESNYGNNSRLLNKNKRNNIQNNIFPNDLELNQSSKDPFGKKRMVWLKNEQVNLEKQNEMNYIFNQKIKEDNPRVRNISELSQPKAQNFMYNQSPHTDRNKQIQQPIPRNQNIRIRGSGMQSIKSQPQLVRRNQPQKMNFDQANAVRRRQQAKRDINSRRQRLANLYRNGW